MDKASGTMNMLLILAFFNVAQAAANTPSIHEIINDLTAQEGTLRNLHVTSEEVVLRQMTGSGDWVKTLERTTVEAWYNGFRDSKARVEIRGRVCPWVNGASDYAKGAMSVGFDGTQGRLAVHLAGPSDKPFPARLGEIRADRPVMLRSYSLATGLALSLFGYDDGRSKPLSQILSGIVAAGIPLEVKEEPFLGHRCLRIAGKVGSVEEVWWLDPSRGMAFRGYDHVQNGSTGLSLRVTRLAEASRGVWYPVEGHREAPMVRMSEDAPRPPGTSPGGRIRRLIRVQSVVANDPDFRDDVFVVQFPPGYMIEDKATGLSFMSGFGPEELANRIDESVEDALKRRAPSELAAEVKPGSATGVSGHPGEAVEGLSGSTRRRWGAYASGAVVIVLVASLTASVIWRRRRRRKVLLLAIALGGSLMGRATFAGGADTPRVYVSNCGVNIGYLVLRLFEKPVSIQSVVKALDASPTLARPCSLGGLKRLWEAHGLMVRGYRAGVLKEVIPFVKAKSAVVVRVRRRLGGKDVGHFVCVWGVGSDALVMDPPSKLRQMNIGEIVDDPALSQFSGEVLVVRKSPAATGSVGRVSQNDPRVTVDLGYIPITTRHVSARVEVRNERSKAFNIKGVGGSCAGCMKALVRDRTVPPGGSVVVGVEFDRERMPCGDVERLVRIVTDDVDAPDMIVVFQFVLQDRPRPEDIKLLPQVIDFGRESRAVIGKKSIPVSIIIPKSEVLREEVQVASSTPSLLVMPAEMAEDRLRDLGRVCSYRVSWKEAPVGQFEETVRFRIGKGNKALVVRVRGDSVCERKDGIGLSTTGGIMEIGGASSRPVAGGAR